MLILATLALAACPPAAGPPAAGPSAAGPSVPQDDQVDALILVELDRVPGLSVNDINAMGLDVASHTVVDGRVQVVANDTEQQRLEQAGIPFEQVAREP